MKDQTPLASGQGPQRYMLEPCSIEVTIEEHLELLKSPKKCLALGLDNTYERAVYQERRQWNGFPELPAIDPNEEIEL